MSGRLSVKKIAGLLVAFGLPLVAVYYDLGEILRNSDRPSEYIGVTFSILAAALFAVVSIIGGPGMLIPGSWRTAWNDAQRIQLRLMRLTYLFVLYIVVLGLLVATEIIEYKAIESLYFVHDIFAYCALVAFIFSLWLPFEIKIIQVTRLEREINERRKRNRPKDRS